MVRKNSLAKKTDKLFKHLSIETFKQASLKGLFFIIGSVIASPLGRGNLARVLDIECDM